MKKKSLQQVRVDVSSVTDRMMTTTPVATADGEAGKDSRELRQRVRLFLNTRGIRGVESIDVEVNGATVVLRGRIASAHDRWLCVSCSSRVAGVLHVIDELEVEDDAAGRRRPK